MRIYHWLLNVAGTLHSEYTHARAGIECSHISTHIQGKHMLTLLATPDSTLHFHYMALAYSLTGSRASAQPSMELLGTASKVCTWCQCV